MLLHGKTGEEPEQDEEEEEVVVAGKWEIVLLHSLRAQKHSERDHNIIIDAQQYDNDDDLNGMHRRRSWTTSSFLR